VEITVQNFGFAKMDTMFASELRQKLTSLFPVLTTNLLMQLKNFQHINQA